MEKVAFSLYFRHWDMFNDGRILLNKYIGGNLPNYFVSCIVNALVVTYCRYACLLPHANIIFCDIIYEFGKRGDLASALTVYEASKKNLSSTNMYIYRTAIDVCGSCGDYLKSRHIYEVFATFIALFQTGF